MRNTTTPTPQETATPDQAIRQLVAQMAGRRLPSERTLAARLHISRPRLRSLLAGLQAEGLIERRLGSGTYAVAASGERPRRVVLLIDEALKLGDDPFFTHFLELLQTSLQAQGARCLIERAGSDGILPPLEDGALTLGLAGSALLAAQRPEDPPIVGLLLPPETRPRHRASVFVLEDREAGRAAGRHLAGRGCRDILFVGRHDIPASRERLAGAEEAVLAAGGRFRVIESHLNYAAGLKLGSALTWPSGAGSVGIIANNDWLAVGLSAGLLRQSNVRVPSGCLVSFDGLPLTADPASGITSLAVPLEAIAQDALAEMDRLGRTPASVGRVIAYPLHWRTHAD